jgi:simple sugar transport system permease protein
VFYGLVKESIVAKVNQVPSSSSPQEKPSEATERRPSFLKSVGSFFLRRREASIFVIAILLLIAFQIGNTNFLSLTNIQTLAEYTAETAIIAAGEVMILVLGEIDLSVGFTYALAPYLMYTANVTLGIPLVIGIIVALLISTLIGLLNGFIVVYFKIPSFIATLGSYFFLNGLTLTISNSFQVTTPDAGTFWNAILGHDIYIESLWALLIVIVVQVILSKTRWGLHTVSVGSNAVGSSEVGINVNAIKLRNFMLASLLAGFAGLLLAFRVSSIDPTAGGANIMFMAVAGAVIGGTALQGGSGTIVGAVLGVFVLSILQDGLNLIGVNAQAFDIILGIMIVIAMILNTRIQQLRRAGRS